MSKCPMYIDNYDKYDKIVLVFSPNSSYFAWKWGEGPVVEGIIGGVRKENGLACVRHCN